MSAVLREWNARFQNESMDASLVYYPTTAKNLPERLSEMFHFDRRGYIVGKEISKIIIPLLDDVEPQARKGGVRYVENQCGVLRGFFRIQDPI